MRKVIVSMYLSLDGVMEKPSWIMPYMNDEIAKFQFDLLLASDALLLGRVTYESFAASWPAMTGDEDFADTMNRMPKYVATTTLEEAQWNASLVRDNIVDEVTRLKRQPGQSILIYGSGDLIHTLKQYNLIDEYYLLVPPVTLGSGRRLFQDGADVHALKLIEARTTRSGVVILSYRPEKND